MIRHNGVDHIARKVQQCVRLNGARRFGDGANNKNPTLFQASPTGEGGMSDLFCTLSWNATKKSWSTINSTAYEDLVKIFDKVAKIGRLLCN